FRVSPSIVCITHPAVPEYPALSLHDALPILSEVSTCTKSCLFQCWVTLRGTKISRPSRSLSSACCTPSPPMSRDPAPVRAEPPRSEEHTSELQSPDHLVCRLLLEKKKRSPRS